MNRLHTELRRLYGDLSLPPPETASAADVDPSDPTMAHAQAPGPAPSLRDNQTRALVMALSGPADWSNLQRVWQGVQVDLGWPAPAIAVAGPGGFQLWMSVAQPVSLDAARQVLEALRRRYVPDIDPQRLRLWPTTSQHTVSVPAPLQPGGPWSAFVAPDLAPMFSDECWLDLPPNAEGQADLLSRLSSIPHADLAAGMARLASDEPAAASAAMPTPVAPPTASTTAPMAAMDQADGPSAAALVHRVAQRTNASDPREFLLSVMNDDGVPLALRIDAAKALLAAPR